MHVYIFTDHARLDGMMLRTFYVRKGSDFMIEMDEVRIEIW